MKKLLLSLMSLLALQAQAAVEMKFVFDFSNLSSLTVTPTLTEPQLNLIYGGDGVRLQANDRTFTAGAVTMSFEQAPSSPGAGFTHYGEITTLTIGKYTKIKFEANSGCTLSSIEFNRKSDIQLSDGQPGRIQNNNLWTAQGENVTAVTLEKGPQDSQIDRITVTYLRPSTPLDFLSSTPVAGGTFTGSFKTMTLSFSTSVTKVNNNDASPITLTGTDVDEVAISQTMTATASGSYVTLTAPTAIEKDANLKIHVPAGIFENSEGAPNEVIDIAFTVKAKRDTFNPVTIEPTPGTIGELPEEIRLTFNNVAAVGTGYATFQQGPTEGAEDLLTYLDFPSSSIELDAEDKKIGIIKHGNGKQVDASTWTIEIPAGLFHNQYYQVDEVKDRWNEAMTITYVVDGTQAGPQDSPILKAAKKLIKQTQEGGVGFPATTTETYNTLVELVNAENTPTDEALTAAMGALYNEPNVVMPEKDKWYKIAGINNADSRLYLTLNNDHTAIGLGTGLGNATAFKVIESTESKIVFQTKEGLFLHIPTVIPQHEGTSDTNLTNEQTPVNTLTLAKFLASSVEGADPASLFGAFTIYGSLGTVSGNEEFAYAMLNHSTSKITTYPNIPLAFSEGNSNAFVLIETTEPVDYVDMIYPTVGLRPDAIDNAGDDMKLVIYGPASTEIVDASLIFYTKSTDGEDNNQRIEFTGDILTPTDAANTFSVNTAGLAPGMYNIVMEKGAFNFVAPEGKSVYNFDLSRILTIRGEVTPPPTPSGDIDPTATLSRTNINRAGDELFLTIGNVNKAILQTPSTPYYIYADGEQAGQKVEYSATILTARANTLAGFNVATSGLDEGQYTLIMPAGTFIFEANDANETVTDKELRVTFTVKTSDAPVTNFSETLTNVSFINPLARTSSVVFKDVVLNDLIIYAYNFDVSNLVAGSGKVKVKSTMWGSTVIEGKLVKYDTFQQDYGDLYGMDLSEVYALRFVPDKPIEGGELDNSPGIYGFFFDVAAFGDANYGKWLNDPTSVAPGDCRVNPEMAGPTFQINNDTGYDPLNPVDPTPVEPVKGDVNGDNEVKANQSIYDLQGRRVENMKKKGVYIVNGKKLVVK